MITERTPFFSASSVYGDSRPVRVESPAFSLHAKSTALLEATKDWTATSCIPLRPPQDDPAAELTIHLYALYLVSQPPALDSSIRATLAHSALGQKIQAFLCDAIEDLLDAGGQPLGEASVEELDAEEIIWRSWPVEDDGGMQVCGESGFRFDDECH